MIRFGPSGNSARFYNEGFKVSEQAPAWVFAQGLNAFEYSFGRGIRLSSEKASRIGEEIKKYDIQLSVHAPYYINLSHTDQEKVKNSFQYIFSSLEMLKLMNGSRCVVHLGSASGMDRNVAIKNITENLKRLIDEMYKQDLNCFYLCPETMGKYSQIGTAEEIVEFCKLDKIILPCFDFGHINSYMQGKLDSVEKFNHIVEYAFNNLPDEKVRNMHVHFSKIKYGGSGEIKHLNFDDDQYGPDFSFFAEVIKNKDLTPVIICESADNMADDAMTMKEIYLSKL